VDTVLDNYFGVLADTPVFEAGHGGNNDCLAHTLLACLSPSFRSIEKDNDRNILGSKFRRVVLPEWQSRNYIDVKNEKDNLPKRVYLGDKVADEVGRLLGVNILYCTNAINTGAGTPEISFTNNKSRYTIGIYGTRDHFMPIRFNAPGPSPYIMKDFDGESYVKGLKAHIVTERECPYKEGDIVTYNGSKYRIYEIEWSGANPGDPVKCTNLYLHGPIVGSSKSSFKVASALVTPRKSRKSRRNLKSRKHRRNTRRH
jgi:hypothetical protein